ncbi:MAG: acetylxylan esterase, partial [Planctomycetaceae bacterium]
MPFNAARVLSVLVGWMGVCTASAAADKSDGFRGPTAHAVAELSAKVLSDEDRTTFQNQAWKALQAQGRVANQRDQAAWAQCETRQQWEHFRDERLLRLRSALGGFPTTPVPLQTRVTSTIVGDGFTVANVVYQSRPGFWVSANLYAPSTEQAHMPAILIAHSHHRPKTQGELQDMGMTWARRGCLVLVIDQVGHGERADHPFQSAESYAVPSSGFRWWRQDYYHRYDINVQLHLTGQSLMGWMVWDLMRGVDLLLERPDVDPTRIMLLGAVAGGGDPAAVTAALDRSITAAVPFNFGGPQPETRFPLPADAEQTFNYLGGAYWEGTRNLRRTG